MSTSVPTIAELDTRSRSMLAELPRCSRLVDRTEVDRELRRIMEFKWERISEIVQRHRIDDETSLVRIAFPSTLDNHRGGQMADFARSIAAVSTTLVDLLPSGAHVRVLQEPPSAKDVPFGKQLEFTAELS